MSDPQRQAPPERPDPSTLLIEAVSQRQSDLAQRLAQQWVHRRGWPSLESFVKGPLLRSCGPEARDWLRQRLGLDTSAAVLREALAEAMAPLRASGGLGASTAAPQALQTTTPQVQAEDPWRLPELQLVDSPAPDAALGLGLKPEQSGQQGNSKTTPAPVPEGLAGLRAWLHSDAA